MAVVDTGIDFTQPDLQGQVLQGATITGCQNQRPWGNGDFRGPDGQNNGDEHGTHVDGIIAAVRGNGVVGVAPSAKILPVKVLEDGSGSGEDIGDGIRWAADHGADVINLSLGSVPGGQAFSITGLDSAMKDAIAYARSKGVLTVAAAGNSATALCNDPAFTSEAICVGATDRNGLHSWYSELPNKTDFKSVSAPGGAGLTSCDDDIWSTVPRGTGSAACGQGAYDAYAGTSMATPHVAGVAALLSAQGRTVDHVEDALLSTAVTRAPGAAAAGRPPTATAPSTPRPRSAAEKRPAAGRPAEGAPQQVLVPIEEGTRHDPSGRGGPRGSPRSARARRARTRAGA